MILFRKIFFQLLTIIIFFVSCSGGQASEMQTNQMLKPGSSYSDTLEILEPAILFFNPDSAQIVQLKKQYKPQIFESLTHEYFYQQKTAKVDISNHYPNIKLVEVVNSRYLLFVYIDHKKKLIDLNEVGTFSGCFVFNGIKDPVQVDMMSFMNDAYYYFNK